MFEGLLFSTLKLPVGTGKACNLRSVYRERETESNAKLQLASTRVMNVNTSTFSFFLCHSLEISILITFVTVVTRDKAPFHGRVCV